jgi:hypothetical protein
MPNDRDSAADPGKLSRIVRNDGDVAKDLG